MPASLLHVQVLEKHGQVSTETGDKVRAFIAANQTQLPAAGAAAAASAPAAEEPKAKKYQR